MNGAGNRNYGRDCYTPTWLDQSEGTSLCWLHSCRFCAKIRQPARRATGKGATVRSSLIVLPNVEPELGAINTWQEPNSALPPEAPQSCGAFAQFFADARP